MRAPGGVDLSSNDYLGLASHPHLKEQMMAAIARDGVGSTGSRLLRGEARRLRCDRAAFRRLSRDTQRSLISPAGYLANLAVSDHVLRARGSDPVGRAEPCEA